MTRAWAEHLDRDERDHERDAVVDDRLARRDRLQEHASYSDLYPGHLHPFYKTTAAALQRPAATTTHGGTP